MDQAVRATIWLAGSRSRGPILPEQDCHKGDPTEQENQHPTYGTFDAFVVRRDLLSVAKATRTTVVTASPNVFSSFRLDVEESQDLVQADARP